MTYDRPTSEIITRISRGYLHELGLNPAQRNGGGGDVTTFIRLTKQQVEIQWAPTWPRENTGLQ